MAYTVKASDLTDLDMNETDGTDAILQHIAVILATTKGTVPLYRDFGISADIIDLPVNVAQTKLAAEISEVLDKYEPRATVTGVTFRIDASNPGKVIPIVEVEIDE